MAAWHRWRNEMSSAKRNENNEINGLKAGNDSISQHENGEKQ